MIKRVTLFITLCSFLLLMQCNPNIHKNELYTVQLKNKLSIPVIDAAIQIPWSDIDSSKNTIIPERINVMFNGVEIASQYIDNENNGPFLLVLISMDQNSTGTLSVQLKNESEPITIFPKRTYAELSVKEGGYWEWVTKENGNQQYEYKGGKFKNMDFYKVPEQHTDHSFDIRYEGPGWESDKVGYRFYLDWRNANDVFGKKTSEMILQNVGLDGFDSYHENCYWGQDILKVGETLGLGSIAYWTGTEAVRVEKTDSIICRIALNGLLKSAIETNYFGWQTANSKVNLNSNLSILGGSRLSHCQLELSEGNQALCTGIIKYKGIEVETNFADTVSDYVFLATYGLQSLANDSLGLAVIAHRKYVTLITDDSKNQIMVLQPINHQLDYYFLAAWQQELNGITNKNDFSIYLNNLIQTFNNPIEIIN